MSKIYVFMNLTLDGVIQAPGRSDEDPRNGFAHGGWATPYQAMSSNEAREAVPNFSALLLGRITYQSLYEYWPKQTGNPMTEMLNHMQKYVVSTTLKEPLPWVNSTLIDRDVPKAIAALKKQQDQDLGLVVMGSGNLIKTLMRHNLVDRYVLLIHPLVLGSGERLFGGDGMTATMELVSAKPAANGVVVATYQPKA